MVFSFIFFVFGEGRLSSICLFTALWLMLLLPIWGQILPSHWDFSAVPWVVSCSFRFAHASPLPESSGLRSPGLTRTCPLLPECPLWSAASRLGLPASHWVPRSLSSVALRLRPAGSEGEAQATGEWVPLPSLVEPAEPKALPWRAVQLLFHAGERSIKL